jgi:hypothetical protein
LKRAVIALALVLLAPTASAQTPSTKIFQLGGPSLPASLKSAPEKLTQVLAVAFGARSSIVPIEDAAEIAECSLTTQTCLEKIANSAKVTRIIFGRIDPRDDGAIVVKLTLFDTVKGESQKNFTLAGETTAELVSALEDKLEIARPAEKQPPKRELDPPVTTPVPAPATSGGGVSASTWVMIVGGGITMGAGLVFLGQANTLRRELAQATADTRADLDRLVLLERAGKRRLELGAGVLAAGGLVTTIGVVRLVLQKRSGQPEKPALDVAPTQGGAMVTFRMGWR